MGDENDLIRLKDERPKLKVNHLTFLTLYNIIGKSVLFICMRVSVLMFSLFQDIGFDYYIVAESFETSVPWDRFVFDFFRIFLKLKQFCLV